MRTDREKWLTGGDDRLFFREMINTSLDERHCKVVQHIERT